jgi:hypothetical protein
MTIDLVKLGDNWKIDRIRYSTRRDASGATEEMHKLRGDWQLVVKNDAEQFNLVKEGKLHLEPDAYQFSLRLAQINLFGGGRPDDIEEFHRDWRVRLYPAGNSRMIELEWEGSVNTEKLVASYVLQGDTLTLQVQTIFLNHVDTGPGEKTMVFNRCK